MAKTTFYCRENYTQHGKGEDYHTVTKRVGVHPNTVRLYEKLGLIPEAERLPNGYRVFTEYHIQQFILARTAFKVEVLQNGLRKKIIHVVKLFAKGKIQEAIELSKLLLSGIDVKESEIFFTRKQTAGVIASILYFPMLIFSGATLPYEVMTTGLHMVALTIKIIC